MGVSCCRRQPCQQEEVVKRPHIRFVKAVPLQAPAKPTPLLGTIGGHWDLVESWLDLGRLPWRSLISTLSGFCEAVRIQAAGIDTDIDTDIDIDIDTDM